MKYQRSSRPGQVQFDSKICAKLRLSRPNMQLRKKRNLHFLFAVFQSKIGWWVSICFLLHFSPASLGISTTVSCSTKVEFLFDRPVDPKESRTCGGQQNFHHPLGLSIFHFFPKYSGNRRKSRRRKSCILGLSFVS